MTAPTKSPTFGELDYLYYQAETLREVHDLAALVARIVVAARRDGGLLPLELVELVEQVAERVSVRRRLAELGES
jgi:hypothetical protein